MLLEETGNFLTICLLCFGAGFITAWAAIGAGNKRREKVRELENRRIMQSFRRWGGKGRKGR